MKDTLNLKYHEHRLVKFAVKKYKLKRDAAKALGITTTTLKKKIQEINEDQLHHKQNS